MELYSYREDPFEQIEVAEQQPDQVEAMRKLLDRWERVVSSSSLGEAAPDQPLDEETLEQLRALGYLE